ncbi:hypothetical protein CCP4SC76_8140002 [Gammaproteobacteria bacterium]
MNIIRVNYEMMCEEDDVEHTSRLVTSYQRKDVNSRQLYAETEDDRKSWREKGAVSRRDSRKYRGRSQHSQG